jgi:hypothetical protein
MDVRFLKIVKNKTTKCLQEWRVLKHSNSKFFYAYANKRLNTASRQLSSVQRADGSCATDPTEMANIFVTEFHRNYACAKQTFVPHFSDLSCKCEFNDPVFDFPTVYKALRNVSNSAAGPDNLPGCLFRRLALELTPSLVIIFQKSYLLGCIPDMWRLACVRPIHKKGVKDLASNYRPISLTCVACKLMEGIVRNAMNTFLEINGLFTKSQHGFRAKYSCQTSLLAACKEYIKSIEHKQDVDVIYFDFAKAFDAVSHPLLLVKLSKYGFGKYLISWVTDFLCKREQYVSIGSTRSSTASVPSGVIQGSVLNDLPEVIKSAKALLYADDLKLIHASNCTADVTCLQSDIDAVLHWSEQWLLPLNVSKLQHLHIGWRHACPAYYCGAVLIKSIDEATDLGVMFTNSLSFSSHINRICKRANSVCSLLFRSFECRDPSLLSSLYATYVRPILECCTSVWSPRINYI